MLGDFVTLIERSSMKNLTLPALLLAFMATSYHSYGSPAILEETINSKTTNSSYLTKNSSHPQIVAGSYNKIAKDIKSELDHLEKGIISLSLGQTTEALENFKKAVGYGSPLGYLYMGALTANEQDLNIVQLAIKHQALPKNIFEQHANYLVHAGFLTRS